MFSAFFEFPASHPPNFEFLKYLGGRWHALYHNFYQILLLIDETNIEENIDMIFVIAFILFVLCCLINPTCNSLEHTKLSVT